MHATESDTIRPYLIQRGSFKDVKLDAITGIDSLVRWDYMGSAEFEFGGLPASLRRIVGALDGYAAWPTDILAHDGRALVLFCKPTDRAELVRLIPDIRDRKVRPKEPTYLHFALKGEGYAQDINFWWDIDNDWMAWLGEENTERVKRALEKVRERWTK